MSGIPWETVTLTTLSRDRGLFPELLAEARDIAMRQQEGKLVIHTPWGIEWKPFGLPRQKRPIDSVVLREGIAETIKQDISAFLQRRQWYADRGMHDCTVSYSTSKLTYLGRNSISKGLSPSWSTRLRQIVIHPSFGRFPFL